MIKKIILRITYIFKKVTGIYQLLNKEKNSVFQIKCM